jgi:ABC-2 type transport system ATP-binding protein
MSLARELRQAPGVAMVVPFGSTLHVSGIDEGALQATVEAYSGRPGVTWERSEPSLEDVFIRLMSYAPDNFAEAEGARP